MANVAGADRRVGGGAIVVKGHRPVPFDEARRPISASLTVGVISDTHGLLRPEAVAGLRSSDLLVHAGDVGSPEILDELRAVAPTYAVRGNVDRGACGFVFVVTVAD